MAARWWLLMSACVTAACDMHYSRGVRLATVYTIAPCRHRRASTTISARMQWLRLITVMPFLLGLATGTAHGQAQGAASGPSAVVDTTDRFFGAVQAIYNPDRASQAGVQWERLIFPWSLIQKDGPTTWSDGYFSDRQIAQESSRGIQLIGLAAYTPQWATSTPQTEIGRAHV